MHKWWKCAEHSECANMRMGAAKSEWWARVRAGSAEQWKPRATWRAMQVQQEI